MVKENPIKFIKELLHRVDTDDTFATAKPIQILLQRKVPVVVDSNYSYDAIKYSHPEFNEWFDSREECGEALLKYGYSDITEEYKEALKEIREHCISYHWETNQAFLTHEGYDAHIKLNKHNLGEYRKYVVHSFRNPEMTDLFKALRALVDDADLQVFVEEAKTELLRYTPEDFLYGKFPPVDGAVASTGYVGVDYSADGDKQVAAAVDRSYVPADQKVVTVVDMLDGDFRMEKLCPK